MAEKDSKWPQNKPGKVYVDENCIACDACVTAAPNNFLMNDDDGHAYVSKQPDSEEEKEQIREAIEGCPVESIGEDGDES